VPRWATSVATLPVVSHLPRRPLVLLAFAAALAAGCGGSDDGSDGAGTSTAGGSDRQQVRSAVEGLYEDLADYDAEAVCERMSPSAQRQIAAGGGARSDATCADAFGKFLDQAKENGGLKRTLSAKIGDIEIDGAKALVTVSFGAQSGQIPLRKIGEDWKMGVTVATPSTEPPVKPKR
jgi:hypothetical protein